MKSVKRIFSVIITFCLCISLAYSPSISQAKSITKKVNKVIAKDKNLKVKFSYVKNGKIYINIKNTSKEDLEVFFTWTNMNGTFRYADSSYYTCYKDTNRTIKLVYYSSDTDNYKYTFKKGKFQMLVTYSTDELDGKIKKTQLKTKKITVK